MDEYCILVLIDQTGILALSLTSST